MDDLEDITEAVFDIEEITEEILEPDDLVEDLIEDPLEVVTAVLAAVAGLQLNETKAHPVYGWDEVV